MVILDAGLEFIIVASVKSNSIYGSDSSHKLLDMLTARMNRGDTKPHYVCGYRIIFSSLKNQTDRYLRFSYC